MKRLLLFWSSLALLVGFCGCNHNEEEDKKPYDWGQPVFMARICGYVTDKDNNPLESIQVTGFLIEGDSLIRLTDGVSDLDSLCILDDYVHYDSVVLTTDSRGHYLIPLTRFPTMEQRVLVVVTDPHGKYLQEYKKGQAKDSLTNHYGGNTYLDCDYHFQIAEINFQLTEK